MSYVKQDESGGGDTYTLRAAQSGSDVDIQLDATTGADSDVKLKAGTNITLTEASDTITIDAAAGGSPGGSNTEVQFNDGGSFNGDNGLTYDKTNEFLKLGSAAIQEDTTMKLHVVGSDASLCIEDQDSSTTQGPSIRFSRIKTTPVAGDVLGQITFRGEQNTGSGIVSYGSVRQEIVDPASATKTGRMVFKTINSSSQSDKMQIDSQITSLVNHNFQGLIKVNNQAGTAGQVLTSQGPSADPIWAAAGGGGGSSFPQIATSPSGDYYIPFALPPLSYNILSFSSTTISDDLIFSPVLFTNDTTITEMGTRYGGGTLNPFAMCIYETDANNMPLTKITGSEIAFATPGSSFNVATFGSPITLSANEFYWVGFTNTSTGSNVSITAVASASSPVTTNGTSFNRSTVSIFTGTINSLPATVTTSNIVAGFAAPFVFFA
tara:strand:+ start:1341 stop:2648 length:1308 start_codon:yes stop_codon:yes gene_type:complete